MKINHNISALVANGHLKKTNKALDKSLERLSSGYRINHAADDSAGMAISQKMKTQIRGLEQSSRNASDGISVIQTAEGALNEVEAMLQRGRELAVQAANGTYTAEDREAIQKEIDQLRNEIQRISNDTEFNKKSLLNGDVDRKTHSDNIHVKMIALTDQVKSQSYEVTGIVPGEPAQLAAVAAPGMTATGASKDGTLLINGEPVEIKQGESLNDIKDKITTVCDRAGIIMSVDATTGAYTFSSNEAGSHRKIEILCDADLAREIGVPTGAATGTDAEIDPPKNEPFTSTTEYTARGNVVTIKDQDGFEMKFEVLPAATGDANITILDAGR